MIDTNLNGTWWMMQEAAQRWRDKGATGNIINIVATVERGMPQSAHSCAARAGVIYLSKDRLDRMGAAQYSRQLHCAWSHRDRGC